MRTEHQATITENLRLSRQLAVAKDALQFYADQKHYDTVDIGHPQGIKNTRLLDNGGTAEDALKAIEAL